MLCFLALNGFKAFKPLYFSHPSLGSIKPGFRAISGLLKQFLCLYFERLESDKHLYTLNYILIVIQSSHRVRLCKDEVMPKACCLTQVFLRSSLPYTCSYELCPSGTILALKLRVYPSCLSNPCRRCCNCLLLTECAYMHM